MHDHRSYIASVIIIVDPIAGTTPVAYIRICTYERGRITYIILCILWVRYILYTHGIMAHFCPGKYNNILSGFSLARRRDTTRQPVATAAAEAARFGFARASSGCEKVRLVGTISSGITDFRRPPTDRQKKKKIYYLYLLRDCSGSV